MLRGLLARLGGARGKSVEAAAPAGPAPSWLEEGQAALAAGRLADAARLFDEGVRAQPQNATLRLKRGFVLLQQGQFDSAAEALRQALALRRPGDGVEAEALYYLGCAEGGLGDLDDALASFDAAVRARPDFPEAMEAALRASQQLGRHGEAAGWANRLAALRPGPRTGLMLARALLLSGARAEALDRLDELCADAPANVDAAALRFDALWQLGRFDDALAQAEHVLRLTGPHAGALVNLAFVLERLDRLDEALIRADEALTLDPASIGGLMNRVAILTGLNRVAEARDAAREALRHHPDNADLHWNLGFALLLLGEYAEGWREHEWRFRSGAVAASGLRFEQPPWRGEDLAGRTLLVHGEQGFGDNIQFVRYVPQLAKRARAVLLQMPAGLESLLEGLAPNCRLLRPGDRMPAFDFHCPVMSLPALCGTTLQTVPAMVPYLRADAAKVQAWRERLGRERLNVGIAWSGRATYANDHRRSMRLANFRAIAAEGCRFVTLQPQVPERDLAELAAWPDALDAGRELADFADTAALVEAVDLVVTTDTSVAHLAGALGKPVWILLACVPDWRWLLAREDSPWYPTARLFRQPVPGDWTPVLERVRAELGALAAGAATAPA